MSSIADLRASVDRTRRALLAAESVYRLHRSRGGEALEQAIDTMREARVTHNVAVNRLAQAEDNARRGAK